MKVVNKNEEVENLYQEGQSWYEQIFQVKEQQLALFRLSSIVLSVLLSLSLIGLIALSTKEHVEPFLALVDKRTGEVTTPTRLNVEKAKANWAMIRYFASLYVRNKESYSSHNLNEPYQTVMTMSDRKVKTQIDLELRPEFNPQSPIKQLGKQYYQIVSVHSINKLSNEHLLDVRFTTHIVNSETYKVERSKDWRVTMKWTLLTQQRTLAEWDKNPIGFTVIFYDKQPVVA